MQLTFPFASENRFIQLRPWWSRGIFPLALSLLAVATILVVMTTCCHK